MIDRNYNQYVSLLESVVPILRGLNRLGVAVIVSNPSSCHFLNVNPKERYQPQGQHSILPVPWEGTPDLTIQLEESLNEDQAERQYSIDHLHLSVTIIL